MSKVADLTHAVADLTQRLAEAEATIATQRAAYVGMQNEIAALRRQLAKRTDDWEDRIADYMAEQVANGNDRVLTMDILQDALGIAWPDQNVAAWRRLAQIMRYLPGGWRPSNNVASEASAPRLAARGYIRYRY